MIPSYRMVRDTLRLQLAGELKRAAHLTYLAARRAEYEHAALVTGQWHSHLRYLQSADG